MDIRGKRRDVEEERLEKCVPEDIVIVYGGSVEAAIGRARSGARGIGQPRGRKLIHTQDNKNSSLQGRVAIFKFWERGRDQKNGGGDIEGAK